jgi:hypothetical protein
MNAARAEHATTLLPSGKVLVSGGGTLGSTGAGAELYDPASGLWTSTGAMNVSRAQHTATLLANGKVLVADSINESSSGPGSAELYDPTTGLWTSTSPMAGSHLAPRANVT